MDSGHLDNEASWHGAEGSGTFLVVLCKIFVVVLFYVSIDPSSSLPIFVEILIVEDNFFVLHFWGCKINPLFRATALGGG